MMHKSITIGLDRDGTINQDPGRSISSSAQFIPIPGSLEAVALIRRKGYNIVVLTNQAGISRGETTIADVDNIHQYMLELLGAAGCPSIDGIYYSTTNLKQDIYAKPNVGMFRRAEKEQKLKYLVAVRPYTISAQYLVSIIKSLDSIQEDRVRINFVPGMDNGEESFGEF
jgi:HAD superfamily hydrolase (TIGR01662 family)